MDATVTALTTAVTPATLFAQLADVAPIVVTGILVGFGLNILRKSVKGVSKGGGRL